MKKIFLKRRFAESMVLIAGILTTFAFAPFCFFPCAIFGPALLLFYWLTASYKRAFFLGFLYGLVFFGSSVYWVFNSIYMYGNASWPLAAFITGGFILTLALFPALTGYLLTRYFRKNNLMKSLGVFPALWVLSEWVRSWIFTGFPWVLLGTSQINAPLKGLAPFLSVYGVSFAVTFTAGAFVEAFRTLHQKKFADFYKLSFAVMCLWILATFLNFIHWTTPLSKPIQVSLVQGNIEQSVKWTPEAILPTLNRYVSLTEQHWQSRLIVWPESAIPTLLQDSTPFLEKMAHDARAHHAAIITGIPMQAKTDGYYNAVITLGLGEGTYLKHRLVPFGEYIPFPWLFKGFFNAFNIPMSDFIPDEDTPAPLRIDQINIATFICYEIAYPELVRDTTGNADMLLTVNNDGWFGRSIAQAQHLEMAEMRALELGRPILFLSNTGLTAFIRPDGTLQSIVPPYEIEVLTDTIQPMSGKTPWQRWGLYPVLIAAFLLLLFAIRKQKP